MNDNKLRGNIEILNYVKNPKGEGYLTNSKTLVMNGKTFISAAACMSVWSEGLTWANKYPNKVLTHPMFADNIVLLCCQVTDLAVLNDFRIAEDLALRFPGKRYFIGGCLARRFDIELPFPWERLDSMRIDYQEIQNTSLVHYEKPFWAPEFEDSDDPMQNGNLFRKSYPIRIGVGCSRNCKYCTIKWTRGANYEMNNFDILKDQFKRHDNVVLIADSPSPNQIRAWCDIAIKYDKEISFRNVEPQVAEACRSSLIDLAFLGLLKFFHSPLQSTNKFVLKEMNRDYQKTMDAYSLMMILKMYGTKVATNIIIDYKKSNGIPLVDDFEDIFRDFDYVSWNPYWDGKWDRAKAEKRFQKYIVDKNFEVLGAPKEKLF